MTMLNTTERCTIKQTKAFSGGGCAPFSHEKLEAQRKARAQREANKKEADHQAWLATPEGLAFTKSEAERQERLRLQREEEIKHEKATREWCIALDRLRNNLPKPGSILDGDVNIELVPAKEGYGWSAIARIGVPDGFDYPAPLRWFPRMRGLVVFLTKGTTDMLAKEFIDEVAKVMMGDKTTVFVNSKRLQILRYNKGNKSAVGTLA